MITHQQVNHKLMNWLEKRQYRMDKERKNSKDKNIQELKAEKQFYLLSKGFEGIEQTWQRQADKC